MVAALLGLPDSIAPDQTVIQLVGIAATVVVAEESAAPGDLIFDKAEEAELDDRVQEELESLRDDMKVLVQESKKATGLNKEKLANDIDALRVKIAVVEAELKAREDDAEMDEEN